MGKGKGFSNQTCTYCENTSTRQGDHIIARNFVLKEHRRSIPKVPCCQNCNGQKARLEHYLTAILPFGGRHINALSSLADVSPRLKKNERLRKEILESWRKPRVHNDQIGIALDPDAIPDYLVWVTKALLYNEFNLRVPYGLHIRVVLATDEGNDVYSRLFLSTTGRYARGNIGNDTLLYEAQTNERGTENAILRFRWFGGAQFASKDQRDIGDTFWAIVEPQ